MSAEWEKAEGNRGGAVLAVLNETRYTHKHTYTIVGTVRVTFAQSTAVLPAYTAALECCSFHASKQTAFRATLEQRGRPPSLSLCPCPSFLALIMYTTNSFLQIVLSLPYAPHPCLSPLCPTPLSPNLSFGSSQLPTFPPSHTETPNNLQSIYLLLFYSL